MTSSNWSAKRRSIFWKIDIEGAEYDILADPRFDGVAARTRCIFLEWHHRELHQSGRGLVQRKAHEPGVYLESRPLPGRVWNPDRNEWEISSSLGTILRIILVNGLGNFGPSRAYRASARFRTAPKSQARRAHQHHARLIRPSHHAARPASRHVFRIVRHPRL